MYHTCAPVLHLHTHLGAESLLLVVLGLFLFQYTHKPHVELGTVVPAQYIGHKASLHLELNLCGFAISWNTLVTTNLPAVTATEDLDGG